MVVRFEVGSVAVQTKDCTAAVASYGEKVAGVLKGMQYSGTVGPRNSLQLNIAFDEALLTRLGHRQWDVRGNPSVDMAALGENCGKQSGDAIVALGELPPAALEIEKSNKKTIW
ncbi:MAG: hypothetical protein KAX19_10050, partial [Candidatus Brocadiae bacterium]|nr:hypothetical protein [Candidatus Brocadiia bacterium]